MIAPYKIGLPRKYHTWRRNQHEALWRLVESTHRFRAAVMPTGFGKSLLYMAFAVLEQGRAIVLTSTKRLMTQLRRDFGSIGLVDIRGAGNYECTMPPPDDEPRAYRSCDRGYCKAGVECSLRQSGCPYYDRRREAMGAQLIVSNYSYWMNTNAYGEGLGAFDTVIMDEAHSALEELSGFLTTQISETDVMMLGLGYPSVHSWRQWVYKAIPIAKRYTEMGNIFDNVIHFKKLHQNLERITMGHVDDWVFEHDGVGLRWTIVDPAALAEKYLFCGVPEVILTSATLTPKTLHMLNVDEAHYDYIEYDSGFPVERRPIYYVPIAKLSKLSDDDNFHAVFDAMDEGIGKRLDRKGVIHCHSYELRDRIYMRSPYKSIMITHNRTNAEEKIELFKRTPPPAILLSPSMTTGVDFPYRECEYQFIPKVPFPDRSSRVLRARERLDKEYGVVLTMTTLEQMVGRGMRADDDQCETAIFDMNFGWLRSRKRHLATKGFWSAVEKVRELPDPPPPLPLTAGQST